MRLISNLAISKQGFLFYVVSFFFNTLLYNLLTYKPTYKTLTYKTTHWHQHSNMFTRSFIHSDYFNSFVHSFWLQLVPKQWTDKQTFDLLITVRFSIPWPSPWLPHKGARTNILSVISGVALLCLVKNESWHNIIIALVCSRNTTLLWNHLLTLPRYYHG